jgi:hypothetical protein
MDIKKVVIWGYKLHSHTHSYIHYAFFKSFSFLGYNTYWLTDNDDVSNIDFSKTLFITSNDENKNIPIRSDCYYVLHNVNQEKYLNETNNVLNIQVFTKKIAEEVKNEDVVFNPWSILKFEEIPTLYFPWATDLLPNEVNTKEAKNNTQGDKYCFWAGTYGDHTSIFQNGTELTPFFNECEKNGIRVLKINPWSKPISFEENKDLVNKSFVSPSIQGPWQVNVGYIPCRIFKNISYGHFGYTNSEIVNSIFDNQLVFGENPIDLFLKTLEKKSDPKHIHQLEFLMEEVKNKHTYVNRINLIINSLEKIIN